MFENLSKELKKGIPNFIAVVQANGVWNSTYQVRCHYPSPTGDWSDWLYYDIPCASETQANFIAQQYADAFDIKVKP